MCRSFATLRMTTRHNPVILSVAKDLYETSRGCILHIPRFSVINQRKGAPDEAQGRLSLVGLAYSPARSIHTLPQPSKAFSAMSKVVAAVRGMAMKGPMHRVLKRISRKDVALSSWMEMLFWKPS